MENIIFPKFMS